MCIYIYTNIYIYIYNFFLSILQVFLLDHAYLFMVWFGLVSFFLCLMVYQPSWVI